MVDTVRYVDTEAPGGGSGGSGDPYNSLASWNANEAGAVGAGDRHICNFRSGNTPEPNRIDLTGWSGAGELIIQRWGVANAEVRPTQSSGGHVFTTSTSLNCIIEHIDIDMRNMLATSEEGIRFQASGTARKCQFRFAQQSQGDCIYLASWNPCVHWITDCCFHTVLRSFVYQDGYPDNDTRVINCIGWNCQGQQDNSPGFGFRTNQTANSIMTVINTACHMATANAPCFSASGTGGMTADSGYNCASDGSHTEVGPGSIGNVVFQEGTGGSGTRAMYISLTDPVDLHIHDDPDNAVRDSGVGPADPVRGAYIPLEDYDGDARSGLTADIGFDQIPSAGGVITEMQIDLDQTNLVAALVEFSGESSTSLAQINLFQLSRGLSTDVEALLATDNQVNFARELSSDLFVPLDANQLMAYFFGAGFGA